MFLVAVDRRCNVSLTKALCYELNLSLQAMFLVAFDRRYNISRIKVFSGVGFVDKKITVPQKN